MLPIAAKGGGRLEVVPPRAGSGVALPGEGQRANIELRRCRARQFVALQLTVKLGGVVALVEASCISLNRGQVRTNRATAYRKLHSETAYAPALRSL